jgi:hypothetical protein
MFGLVLDRYLFMRARLPELVTPGGEMLNDILVLEKAEDEINEELGGRSVFEHRQELQKVLGAQSAHMLHSINEALPETSDGRWSGSLTVKQSLDLKKALGFTLAKRPSTIKNANSGLFVDGGAYSGQLLGYFPGLTNMPEHLKKAGALDLFKDDPKHLILSRYDEVILDSRAYADKLHETNPYALCHMANHPARSVKPNVVQLMLDFPSDIDHDVEHLIPNKYAKPPTLLGTPDRSACMYGMCLIALRDVKNEELFVNYRFPPKFKENWPNWYTPVETDDGEKRWGD